VLSFTHDANDSQMPAAWEPINVESDVVTRASNPLSRLGAFVNHVPCE
jgi:hypothetical protein